MTDEFNEETLVENYIIKQLVAKGWTYVPGNELERESLEEPLLITNLEKSLKRINKTKHIEDEHIRQVINQLKLQNSGIEGNKQVLNYIKHGIPVKFERERILKTIDLIDTKNIENNEFIVSNQVVLTRGNNKIRTDVLLFINGIPLVLIECKSPVRWGVAWEDAYNQIKDYERKIPELTKYAQIGIAAEEAARYFPIVRWDEEPKISKWRHTDNPTEDEVKNTLQMVEKEILIDILTNFVFIREFKGKTSKVLPRYMQYRAANKIVKRAETGKNSKPRDRRGLVWHWQGSGKTLTMIFAANKLFKRLGNPTIFLVLDRLDLQTQFYEEFNALDIYPVPEKIESRNELIDTLKHDGGRGKRGIFVVLVHKFGKELDEVKDELEALQETIRTRNDVFVFSDEAHRTQYGTLAATMRDILKNAFFFGFTGTPLSKMERNTYEWFSKSGEDYLDKYFITDSINDKFTVRIAYQPRLQKKVHLEKALLQAFMDSELQEIPEEIREEVGEKLAKMITIRTFMKNPERIELITEDIANHFKENVDNRYKAMIVAVDREACALYKRELDKHLPKEYSEVVISFSGDERKQILRNHARYITKKYGAVEQRLVNGEIVNKYKQETHPKVLIVTDMLITGFDAPELQTMYLDKPLKEHRLLQTIARTNRPYKDVKEAGVVLDYIGIFEDLEKAFANYDKEDLAGAVYDIEGIKQDFKQELDKLMKIFEGIPKEKPDRETMLSVIGILVAEPKVVKEFLNSYKKLKKLFELLGPDTIKAELRKDFQWISAVYIYYYRKIRKEDPNEADKYAKQYYRKTIKYLYESTEIPNLEKDLPLLYLDEEYLIKLEEKFEGMEEKAADIVFTLNKFVLVDKLRTPIHESLTEKVERLVETWKDRVETFEDIYLEGARIIQKINEVQTRKKELGFSNAQYATLLALEDELPNLSEGEKKVIQLYKKLSSHLFKGWEVQTTAKKSVGRNIREFLINLSKEYNLSREDRETLYTKLTRSLEQYGQNN